ncbi:restriction endonuclease subunit S [Aliivibrio salmonicida]|uniref:restriction endonuclease subunit S n=1 Tax=Aliivibrio salmonicida TaxID=40269 RepID=UPI00406C8E51
MSFENVKLSEVCEVIAGQSPPSSSYNNCGIGLPFFQGKTDFGQLNPNIRMWCTEPKKVSQPCDILMSVRAPVGPTNINNVKACIGRGLSAIRCSERIELNFLLHFLRFNERVIADKGTGSTFKAITQKELKALDIPLPQLEEQKKIAEILDAADSLRQKDKQLVEHYDRLSQSLFLDMFGNIESNPKQWKIKEFDHFAIIDTNMTSDFEKYSELPHIGVANIQKNTGELIDYKLVKDENLKSGKYLFTSEHIIYSKIRPNLNKVATPSFSGLASADSYPILPNSGKMTKAFLTYILRSKYFLDFISKHSNRTNIPKANKAQLKQFSCICPPLPLQRDFSEKIDGIYKQKALTQQALLKSEDLFNSLLQQAFKGKLTNS